MQLQWKTKIWDIAYRLPTGTNFDDLERP